MTRRTLVALTGAALLAPFLPLLLGSFGVTWRYPALWPQAWGLRGWRVVADPAEQVLTGLVTSAGIAAAVAVVSGAVGLAAGRALGLHAVPGRRLLELLLLAPVLVPSLAVSLGLQVVFLRYGLTDHVAGVVLAHLVPATPYATLLMTAAYRRYDPDLEEQGRVLGASPLRVLLTVTVPALRSALLVAMTMAFLISWNEYLLTLLVGGGSVRTLPLLLFAAIGSGDTPVAAALALTVALPPVLLLALTARRLGSGTGLVAVGRS